MDEILILEILCSEEGENFVSNYNELPGNPVTKSSLTQSIESSAELLCIKIDRFLEPMIERMDNFTPVIADFDLSNTYHHGVPYNGASILNQANGTLIVNFRITEAVNTVLYNPSQHQFNIPILYQDCGEGLFFNRLLELADPICSGEIPLSISYDLQDLYFDLCVNNNLPPNFLVEICDNGIDDDDDGLIDCDDPQCCAFAGCNCTQDEICDNDTDDDGDGLIDEADNDCWGINSPCMRDHYLEDNFFYSLELQFAEQITAFGGNLCLGVVQLIPPPSGQNVWNNSATPLYSTALGSTTALEEWYDFRITVHWGSATGSQGIFQDLIYRFHLFHLVNEPEFSYSYFSAGGSGTGGAGGVAVLVVTKSGISETKPVTLGPLLFYTASDVCGINNWDPGILGDKVGISVHEFDGCNFEETTGQINTTVVERTYSSGFEVKLGLESDSFPLTGGILYKNSTERATTETNQISSSYKTSYVNDYYAGRINYSYCWLDQGTNEQVHEVPFGNILFLRMMAKKCN